MDRLAILLRLATGLLGGWLTIAIAASAPVFAYGCLAYLFAVATKVQGTLIVVGSLAAVVASLAVLAGAAGVMIVQRLLLTNALVRLTPALPLDVRRIRRYLATYTLLMLPPAAALRAYQLAAMKRAPDAVMTFADVGLSAVATQAAWLIFIAAVLVVYMRGRHPARFVEFLLVYYGAQIWTTPTFTVGVAVASLAVAAGDRLWHKYRAAQASRPVVFAPAELNARGEVIRDVGWPEIVYEWRYWSAHQSAPKPGQRRVVALFAANERLSSFVAAVIVTLFYFVLVGSAGTMFPISYWFMPFAVVVTAIAIPQPIQHMLLLPGCATRGTIGESVLNVWLVTAMRRLAVALLVWFLLNTLFWAIEWRPFDFARVFGEPRIADVELVWLPLAHGIALAGTTTATCLLMAATPGLLTRSGWIHAASLMSAMIVCALAYALLSVLGNTLGTTGTRNVDPQFLLRFVLVSGVVVPLLALAVNLALRPIWRSANLERIASAMQQLSRRMDSLRARDW